MKVECCKSQMKLISTDRMVGGNQMFFQCKKCGNVKIYEYKDDAHDEKKSVRLVLNLEKQKGEVKGYE